MVDIVVELLEKANISTEAKRLWIQRNADTLEAENLLSVFERLVDLERCYSQKKIDVSILVASMADLKFRIDRFQNAYNRVGITDHDVSWLADFLDFKLFDFGSLRYQIFPFDRNYIERSGIDSLPLSAKNRLRFDTKDTYLNIHILKGADLSPKAVEQSLFDARSFFSQVFSHVSFKGFITRTWLIYSKMDQILPASSNIVQFGKRFEIIEEAPIQYQILERVYQTQNIETIKGMTKTTQLQKSVIENLDKVGVAFGYIPF